jgi:hypothetical protein
VIIMCAGAPAVADRAAAVRAAAVVPQSEDPGAERAHPRGLRLRLPRGRMGQAARRRGRQAALRGRLRPPPQRTRRQSTCIHTFTHRLSINILTKRGKEKSPSD